MHLIYESTKALYSAGQYLDIIAKSNTSDDALACMEQPHRLLLARVLIQVDLSRAQQIAERENHPNAPTSARSTCKLILGLARRRDGAFESALAHFRRALQLAQDSRDSHQSAWASVYLFRLLAEVRPSKAAISVLRDARQCVTKAGDPHAAAFLHDSIALIEASTGRVKEARRHLEISASLIEKHPNAWLHHTWAVSSFCAAFLDCDYTSASRHLQEARRLLATTGAEYLRSIIECNEGHAALVTGRFTVAEDRFLRAISETRHKYSALGSLEGLARLFLATGRLDECDDTLKRIANLVETDQELLKGFTGQRSPG